MRRLIVSLILILLTAGLSQAAVENYVDDLNIYASKQFGNFRSELSARYGISTKHFDKLMRSIDSPGDLAVSLWVGYNAHRPVDDVIKQFRLRRGEGWGVIAQESGIKPGSHAFKQLKDGAIDWHPSDFDEVMKRGKFAEKSKVDKQAERERRIQEALELKKLKREKWEQDKQK